MKKAIIIIVSVLVILGGTFAGLFFFTDMFDFLKSSNETFISQAKKLMGMNSKEELTYEDYSSTIENFKTSKDSSFTANANISIKMSGMNTPDENSKKLVETLNSSTFKYSASYDADTKASSAKIGISSDNEDVISLSAVLKDKAVNVSSSDIYDKTLKFDLTKLESFLKQNNISYDQKVLKSAVGMLTGENNTVSPDFIYDLFYISEKDYNSLKDTYGNILEKSIDEDKYTTEKNVKVEVYGDEVKTTAYTLTLTPEDLIDILLNYVEAADEDSTLKGLVSDKYSKVRELLISTSEAYGNDEVDFDKELPKLSSSDLSKLTSNLKKSLEKAKDSAKDTEGSIKMTIYSKKNEPVKAEFILFEDDDDDDGEVIFTAELSDTKNTYTINMSDSSDEKLVVVDEYESTETSRKGTVTITADDESIALNYETIFSDSECKIAFSMTDPKEKTSINYNIHFKDLKSETQNYEYTFGISEESAESIEIKATGSITAGKSDIPSISSENAVDVFALNQTEIKNLVSEIVTSASDKLPAKLSKLGFNVSKEQILSTFSLPQTTTPNVDTPTTPEIPGTTTPTTPTIPTTPTTPTTPSAPSNTLTAEQIRNRALELQKELSELQASSASPEEKLQKAQAIQKEALELQKQLSQLQ